MSNWVSNLFTNLIVDPASLPSSEEQHAAEAIAGNDSRDDGAAPDRAESPASSTSTESVDSAVNAPASDEELIALLRRRVPAQDLPVRLLELAGKQIGQRPDSEDDNKDFLLLWNDILRYFPIKGAESTTADIWLAREKILAALLARRQLEHGSGGTVGTSVYTASGVVIPRLQPGTFSARAEGSGFRTAPATWVPTRQNAIVVKRSLDFDSPPRRQNASTSTSATHPPSADTGTSFQRQNAFAIGSPSDDDSSSRSVTASPEPPQPPRRQDILTPKVLAARRRELRHQLAPSAQYKPRGRIGAYEGNTLPPAPSPEVQRLRAQLEQPRGDTEEFSLQMMLPGSSHRDRMLSLAVLFVPADEDLPCGVVETETAQLRETQQHIAATRVPQEEMATSVTELGERFDAHPENANIEPLELDVRDESELRSVERTPDTIDDVWNPKAFMNAWYGSTAHNNSHTRMLRIVGDAVKEADSKERLRPGTPFYLKAVVSPEVRTSEGAVIFVPDDPTILACGTDVNGLVHDAAPSVLAIREYPREVRGDWEILGRHKRKCVFQGATDGQSALKRICGVQGRDTITRHSLLDIQADDTWLDKAASSHPTSLALSS